MEAFTEKIVTKEKTGKDQMFKWGIIISGVLLSLVLLSIPGVQQFAPFLVAGIGFGAYYLMKSRNIEFEYTYTNGELDIDIIIARRKRKRAFSGSCKDFEIMAKYDIDKHEQYVKGISKTIVTVSSLSSPDIYFATGNNKGQKVMILFEPGEKMLGLMKGFIPKKVFIGN